MPETVSPLENESPLKQKFDQFDVSHMDWTMNDYKALALKEPIQETTHLLYQDWKWRYEHHQNVVASIEGNQGDGKSMSFYSAGKTLGTIYKTPFSLNNLYFELEEVNAALGLAKPCETLMWDEHKQTQAGIMSLMQRQNLSDYEDQLRVNQNNLLFAAVELQDHSHFFTFETKHIIWNETGKYPKGFVSILKTKRYTDRHQLVWRGLVFFPMPCLEEANAYLVKKRTHVKNLQGQKYSTLDPVRKVAKEIVKKRLDDLIKYRRDGTVLPIKRELMMFVIDDEIGTAKFTVKGYTLLDSLIRKEIEEKFKDENEAVYSVVSEKKEEKQREKTEKETQLLKLREAELEEKRKERELQKEALELEKQKIIQAKIQET